MRRNCSFRINKNLKIDFFVVMEFFSGQVTYEEHETTDGNILTAVKPTGKGAVDSGGISKKGLTEGRWETCWKFPDVLSP